MSQQGKVALVTGGARGIGRSMVEHLLAEGAFVAVCDLRKEVGEKAVEEMSETYPEKVTFFLCDVTNDEQLEECFKRAIHLFGSLDILINNAGIGEEWTKPFRRTVEINLNAVISGIRLGFKYMSKEEGGRGGIIVNTGSIGAFYQFPLSPIYSATKAAVIQLSRSYGHDFFYKKSGIKVIAINPGMTETPLIHKDLKEFQAFRDVYDSYDKLISRTTIQNPDSVGKGLIQILRKTENGSLWIIKNDEPPQLTNLSYASTA